ncbi:MAG: hypothetical protein QOG49_380 [Frankiaceae bacterium]|jgi:hypothetical protein|nr:hypothetical protein [Frankiaceae bacterium]
MVLRLRRSGLVLAITAAAMLGGAATAAADPVHAPNSGLATLMCNDGATYTIVTNGNGNFTPGHDVASNSTFVPTAFGPFHGVLTDGAGNVIDEFTDPANTKGSSTKPRASSLSCTFTISDTFTDPNLGLVHFSGTGSVIGFKTPARG